MRAKRTLWATTTIDKRTVKVNLVAWNQDRGRMLYGETRVEKNGNITVDLDQGMLGDPERFDEILLHELVHVIEFAFEEDFARPQPEDCSHHAQFIGAYMPGLLRNLKLA